MRAYILTPVFASALILGACGEAVSANPAADPIPAAATVASVKASATAQGWAIQPEASSLVFSALQEGEAFTGEFSEFSGDIAFDPNDLGNSAVRIEIPLKSVSAGSKDRDSTLPGKAWFATKANPVATYAATEIVGTDTGYEARGTLSLKGVIHPLALPFTVDMMGDRAEMTGQVTLDRTTWNVGAAPWDTDEWVSRAVKLDIKVTATKL